LWRGHYKSTVPALPSTNWQLFPRREESRSIPLTGDDAMAWSQYVPMIEKGSQARIRKFQQAFSVKKPSVQSAPFSPFINTYIISNGRSIFIQYIIISGTKISKKIELCH
jgi:hypothetical protein